MTWRAAVRGALSLVLLVGAAGATPLEDDPALRDASTLALTTTGRKSGQPRTVTIWFVYGDRLYVQAGHDGNTDWYRNLLKTPAVSVKIGNRELRGQAKPLDDPTETARVHKLFKQKYFTARVMSWFGGWFGTGKVVAIELQPTRD